jgi:very-long-chain enoyl-CoA reductase
MPLMNLFRNSGYYWLAGAAVGYFVNHPLYTPVEDVQAYAALGGFALFELLNFITHLQLAALRPRGTRERHVPQGILFRYITCPNYTFEVLSWVSFCFLTRTVATYVFTALGFFQMLQWARQKKARYIRDFPRKFPRSRALMFPPFL